MILHFEKKKNVKQSFILIKIISPTILCQQVCRLPDFQSQGAFPELDATVRRKNSQCVHEECLSGFRSRCRRGTHSHHPRPPPSLCGLETLRQHSRTTEMAFVEQHPSYLSLKAARYNHCSPPGKNIVSQQDVDVDSSRA